MADGIRRRGADLSNSTAGGGTWASGSTGTSSTFATFSEMATVDVRDRTSEFREACRAAKAKRTTPGSCPVLPRASRGHCSASHFSASRVCAAPPTQARQRSAFMSDAAAIGREIKSTAEKLERLSKRARTSPLTLRLAAHPLVRGAQLT